MHSGLEFINYPSHRLLKYINNSIRYKLSVINCHQHIPLAFRVKENSIGALGLGNLAFDCHLHSDTKEAKNGLILSFDENLNFLKGIYTKYDNNYLQIIDEKKSIQYKLFNFNDWAFECQKLFNRKKKYAKKVNSNISVSFVNLYFSRILKFKNLIRNKPENEYTLGILYFNLLKRFPILKLFNLKN